MKLRIILFHILYLYFTRYFKWRQLCTLLTIPMLMMLFHTDLNYNELQTLPAGVFDQLENLKELKLHYNRRLLSLPQHELETRTLNGICVPLVSWGWFVIWRPIFSDTDFMMTDDIQDLTMGRSGESGEENFIYYIFKCDGGPTLIKRH